MEGQPRPIGVPKRQSVGITLFEEPCLISDTTAEAAGGFAALEAGEVPLKGKSNAVKLFALLGDADRAATAQFRRLADEHKRLVMASAHNDTEKALDALLSCRSIAGEGMAVFYAGFATAISRFPQLPQGNLALPADAAAAHLYMTWRQPNERRQLL